MTSADEGLSLVTRRITVGVFSALVAALTILFGLATRATFEAPAYALMLLPDDPRAGEALLTDLIAEGNSVQNAKRILHIAENAYRSDATSAGITRSLALVEQLSGRPERADQLYLHAAKLSRRDLPTDSYLIERSVAKGDVSSALHYYDTAFRVAPSGRALLMPSLANGFTDPMLIEPLAALVRTDPPWMGEFVDWMIANGQPPATLADVLMRSAGSRVAQTVGIRRRLLGRLVEQGDLDQAYRYRASFGRPASAVRDPGFDALDGYLPFDWAVAANDSASADHGAVAGDHGLRYWARDGGGLIAQQLLALQPGNYRIQLILNPAPSSAPPNLKVTLRCNGSTSVALSWNAIAGQSAHFLTIDHGCRYQWLNLEAFAPPGSNAAGAVARVEIERANRNIG